MFSSDVFSAVDARAVRAGIHSFPFFLDRKVDYTGVVLCMYAPPRRRHRRSEASVRVSFVHTQDLKYKHNTRTYRDFEGLE